MRSTCQTSFHRASLAGCLVMLALALGCTHSPQTITLRTAEGTETVEAPLPATMFSMARILEARGNHTECERLLNQILVKNPDYLPAYSELADLLVRQHRLEQAGDVLKAGLKNAPRDPVLLNNAGMCQLLMNQNLAALEYFKKGCAADPADLRYRANLALAQALNGDFKSAQSLYETFLTPQEVQQNFAIIRKIRVSETKDATEATAGRQAPMQAHPVLPPIKP